MSVPNVRMFDGKLYNLISQIWKDTIKFVSFAQNTSPITHVHVYFRVWLVELQQMRIIFYVASLGWYCDTFLIGCSLLSIVVECIGGRVKLSAVQQIATNHCSCWMIEFRLQICIEATIKDAADFVAVFLFFFLHIENQFATLYCFEG